MAATNLRAYVLESPRGGGWELAHGEPRNGTLYRKELAYPGHFTKLNENGEVEFELPVDEALEDHWVDTFNKMKENGVDVPLPIGHNTEPEQRRGTVEKLTKEWNPKREANCLYAYVRFRDPSVAAELKDSNVSLFMPPEFTDGKKNKYVRPIRHVAITDYPVIPDLAPFEQAVAASHRFGRDLPKGAIAMSMAEENTEMPLTWNEVAQELGIDVPEGADEEAAHAAVTEAWDAEGHAEPDGDEGGGEGLNSPEEDELEGLGFEDDEEGGEGFDPLGSGGDIEMPENQRGGGRRRKAPPEMAFSFDAATMPKTIVNQVVEARKTKIAELVRSERISPAAGKQLEKEFCTQQLVGIALSHEASGMVGDNFDSVVRACSLNVPLKRAGEKTYTQDRGEGGGGEKAPIVADAERRQAEMNRRRGITS